MKDRIPTYPGRVRLNPVNGQTNVYDMVRADEPVQEGTPLNKAALITDETAAMFGLGENATVNMALANAQKKLPVGTVIRSSQLDAADNLGGTWVLCNGAKVRETESPELYSDASGLTKYTKAPNADSLNGFDIGIPTPTALFADWQADTGFGAYGNGYYAFPVYNYTATENSAKETVPGIAYTTDPLGEWQVKSFEGCGLTRAHNSFNTHITYCNGRWFFMVMHKEASAKFYLHAFTATDLLGEWTDINITPSDIFFYYGGSDYNQCSRVYENDTHYLVVYMLASSSTVTSRGLYLAKIDKEALTATVSEVVSSTSTSDYLMELSTVSFIDGLLYATGSWYYGTNYDVIWRIDPDTGTATKSYYAVGQGSYSRISNVIKNNGNYLCFRESPNNVTATPTTSTLRDYIALTSSDGTAFTFGGSLHNNLANHRALSTDLVVIDKMVYLNAGGSLYLYDIDTDVLFSTALANFGSYGRFNRLSANAWSDYVPIIESPEAFMAIQHASANATRIIFVRLNCFELPTISEDSVYNYIKIKE